jgi:hypothetical protein
MPSRLHFAELDSDVASPTCDCCLTLPHLAHTSCMYRTTRSVRMCARTSNIKRTNTERKFTQERKVSHHRGCAGLGNVVTLRRKWQGALQMIQPSRMHVSLSPWAAAQHPSRNLKQESQRWSRRNWARCKNRRRAARSDEVRWPGTKEKGCRLPTRV